VSVGQEMDPFVKIAVATLERLTPVPGALFVFEVEARRSGSAPVTVDLTSERTDTLQELAVLARAGYEVRVIARGKKPLPGQPFLFGDTTPPEQPAAFAIPPPPATPPSHDQVDALMASCGPAVPSTPAAAPEAERGAVVVEPPAEDPTSTPETAGGTRVDLPKPEPRARRLRAACGRERAQPSLFVHPKFLRLVDELGMPAPHILGHLEFLWHAAHERLDEPLGDARNVELLARWTGEPGVLATALHRVRFLDDVGGVTRCFRVHDLYDHAPEAVKKRIDRASVRRELGVTIRQRRQASARERWRGPLLARLLARLEERLEEKHASGRRSQTVALSEAEDQE
jgi:hypothetical protein